MTDSTTVKKQHFERYENAKWAAILLKGYWTNQNPEKNYQKAKEPIGGGFTSESYRPPGIDQILDHENKGGWTGWRLPPGIMVIDNEDPDTIAEINRICKGNRPPTQKTTNGSQWTFSCNGDIRGADGVYTRSGLKVTYRLPMKNYVIMPTTNSRSWEHIGDLDRPPEMPEELLPCRMDNQVDLLNCISWEVHRLKREDKWGNYEELLSLSTFFLDVGVMRERIHEAFKVIFGQAYDREKTEYFLQRDSEKLEAGQPLIGRGTYFESLSELKNLKRFSLALERILEKPKVTVNESDHQGPEKPIDQLTVIPEILFPMEVFPVQFQEFVYAMADGLQVEPSIVASVALTVFSGTFGNAIWISPKVEYDVSAFLWLILIASTGYGKSPLLSKLTRPISHKQAEAHQRYQAAMRDYEELLRKNRKDHETYVGEKPKPTHYIVQDHTIEALADVFEVDPRGVLIHLDEVNSLFAGINQYKGGRGNDEQHYLSLFNCDPWKIDRRKETRFIQNTGAAIVGGIQQQIVPEILTDSFFKNGFVARFLVINADSRPTKFSRNGICDATLSYWQILLERAYSLPLEFHDNGFIKRKVLLLTDAALTTWESLYNEYAGIEPFLDDRGSTLLPKLRSYYSLKFILLLHCLDRLSTGKDIGSFVHEDVTEKGIQLTRFFAGQAMKTLNLYRPDKKKLSEAQSRLVGVLYILRDRVKNGRLYYAEIATVLNSVLPSSLQIEGKRLGTMLRGLQLSSEHGREGAFLIWEPGKLTKLFTEANIKICDECDANDEFPEERKINEE